MKMMKRRKARQLQRRQLAAALCGTILADHTRCWRRPNVDCLTPAAESWTSLRPNLSISNSLCHLQLIQTNVRTCCALPLARPRTSTAPSRRTPSRGDDTRRFDSATAIGVRFASTSLPTRPFRRASSSRACTRSASTRNRTYYRTTKSWRTNRRCGPTSTYCDSTSRDETR